MLDRDSKCSVGIGGRALPAWRTGARIEEPYKARVRKKFKVEAIFVVTPNPLPNLLTSDALSGDVSVEASLETKFNIISFLECKMSIK
jgi:hypothetical protein